MTTTRNKSRLNTTAKSFSSSSVSKMTTTREDEKRTTASSKSPNATTKNKKSNDEDDDENDAMRKRRSPLSQVLSPNNASSPLHSGEYSDGGGNATTPTRRHLTTGELTRPSLKVYVEQMTTPPPSSSSPSVVDDDNNNKKRTTKSVEEIAEQLLKESNEGQTKTVLMDLLQTAKENASYKLMLERMKSDEVEYSLRSSRKMSEVTQVYETLKEDKMKAEMKIAKLEEEKKSLMTAAERARSASVDTDFGAKTPLTAPAKQSSLSSSSSFRFATTSTVNDGNNNVGIFASPRWEAVKKSATETAERLRALSSEKGTAASPFTGGKARTMVIEDEEEDIFVDALNTVAQTQQLHRSKRMTAPTTAKPSVRAIEKTQNSIADALRDSNNEVEVKSLLASLDEYVLTLRERISTTTTMNSGEEASTSAPTRDQQQQPGDKNEEEEVLKIADKADTSIKSLFQLLFIKDNKKKEGEKEAIATKEKVDTKVDRVKSDLLKTFEEENDDAQNRLLKKEQNERKKDNEKAVEALNKVQSLLDEKTDEAKRTVETLESERRKNEALRTQLGQKMKEMEDKKKSVASVSVQTEEVEESNSNSKFDEYESLVASLKEENEGKDVQMLQLQQELADSMSAKNAELSKLAKEYREQDEKVSELSHACATLADALESAEHEVEMLKERVKGGGEIEMKMESLKEALTERTHELNIAQSEKTEWEQKYEDLQSEMLFKVAALETLKQSFAELEANEKEVENMESRNGLLADEVEIFEHLFEEEKQKKIDLISKYNEEKEDMLEMINHLGNDMKKYECEAFTWWTKAELENTRAADLEDEIERLQDELERVNEEQDERTELLLDVAKLKEEKRAVDEALEKVDTTNKTLNVRLKKSYERIQELDKEIESANSDRDFLRKEVDEANSRVKVLEAWCKETKVHGEIDDGDDDDTNISDSYDYAKIPARYEELKLENIELMEKLTASKAVEESLSQRLENTMHETDGLKDEAKTALMKSSEMQKMTENAVEKTAQMTSELEEATNEIQKLENLLTVSRRQVQTLEKQLAAPRGEIHQEAEMHPIYENEEDTSAIKEYFEAQNEELTALLASKTSELTQMQAEIEILKNKSSLEEDAKTLRGENYELAVRHKATLERLTATMEEKEALEKSCEHYETTIENMQMVVKELKTEIEKLKAMKSPAPKETSQSTKTIEDGRPSSSEANATAVREKIIYVHNPPQHLPPHARHATTTEEDEMFYDVDDDFHQHRRQSRNAQRVSVYPLAPKGQLPPLHRNAIESYHLDAQRMRLRKECELEERELLRMKQEKRILSARMKEEKRSSSLNKESEKKSTKMKKSNSKKNSSSSATTTATSVDFPAQSLSFKTPSQTGAAKNDESSPPPPPSSSEILDDYKAPKNTPAETTEVPMNTNDDENSSVLLETALTAKLVLENSRKADEKAKHYKKQARAAFKSLENISEEMRKMKQAFVKDQEETTMCITPLTESKFLMMRK